MAYPRILKPSVSSLLQRWQRHQYTLLLMLGVLVADQLTKYLVSAYMDPGEAFPSGGLLQIKYTYNTGMAFGLLPGQTFLMILGSLIGISVLLLFYRNHSHAGWLIRLSLGLQLGGALGNLTDRVTLGYVVDFIKLGWWPIFNMADASISVGIALLAWLLLTSGRTAPAPRASAELPGRMDPYLPDDWYHE